MFSKDGFIQVGELAVESKAREESEDDDHLGKDDDVAAGRKRPGEDPADGASGEGVVGEEVDFDFLVFVGQGGQGWTNAK